MVSPIPEVAHSSTVFPNFGADEISSFWRALHEHLPWAMAWIDGRTAVVRWANRAFWNLTDMPEDTPLPLPLRDMLSNNPLLEEIFNQHLREVCAAQRPVSLSDTPRYEHVVLMPIPHADGQQILLVGGGPLATSGQSDLGAGNDAALLHQTAKRLNKAESLEKALQICTEAVCEATGWPLGHAFLVDSEGRSAHPVNSWRLPEPGVEEELRRRTAQISFEPNIGFIGRVMATGAPLFVRNVHEDRLFLRAQSGEFSHIKSAMAVPIKFQDKTMAILEFFAYDERAPDERTWAFVQTLCELGGRILERRRAELRLRETEQRSRELLDLLPVGVYVCDADGRIMHFNRKAHELWGRAPKLHDTDDRFCGAFQLFTPHGQVVPKDQSPMTRALRSQEPQRDQEVVIERPDGSRVLVLVNIDPLFDNHGRLIGAVNCFQDITRRKKTEDKLREEVAFRKAIEACMPAGLTVVNLDGRLIYVNRAFITMVGWPEHELLGRRPPFPYWARGEHDRTEHVLRETIAGKPPPDGFETKFRRRSGDVFDVLIKPSPLLDAEGHVTGWLASISDITERKRIESSMRFLTKASMEIAQSLDYESVLTSVANLVVPSFADWCSIDVIHTDGSMQHVVAVHSEMSKVQLAHRLRRKDLPRDDRENLVLRVARSGRSELFADVPEELVTAAAQDDEHAALLGGIALRSAMIVPLNARGRILGAITLIAVEGSRQYNEKDLAIIEELGRHCAIAVDKAQLYQESERELAERRRAEQALRENEERIRFTLQSARVGTWDWNIRTGDVHWSENLRELHGLAEDTGQGTFYDFVHNVHPEDRDNLLRTMRRAVDGDGAYQLEYRLNGPDGALRWIEGKGRVVYDEQHNPVAMTGICMEITERRLLEDRFRVAVEASPSAFVMVDSDGRITLVNSQSERLFGYTRHEMLGQTVEMLVPERFRGAHPHLRNKYLTQPMARPMGAGRDLYCLRKDGSEFPVEIGLSPIAMPEGTLVLSAIVDITERKRSEDAIRRVNDDLRQKNEEMEQFVYTVSHDLKSPIVTTVGFLGMLREDLELGDTEQVLDSIQRIERAANRMGELIDDLLQLSRIGRVYSDPKPVRISALIQELVDDLDERIAQARARVVVQPDMPTVLVDRKRFLDVFENLITNALKYGCSAPQPLVEIGGFLHDGEARFFVRDNGAGISKEYHGRIFGLFQRLSNDQEGTGVGLAIVARVVDVHGGRTWVESVPGSGAIFWIALPNERIVM